MNMLEEVGSIVLHNANIYLERDCFCEALVIQEGRIVKTGTEEEVLAAARQLEERTPVSYYDAKGRTVVPGFNDSHMHLMQTGEMMHQVDIVGVKSIDELVERCQNFLAQHPERATKGLHALGWNQDYFEGEKRMPTRHDLDRISTEVPIILERVCGHILCTNTKAIEILGLTAESPQYPDGEFYYGEDGFPNGLFTENACSFVKYLVPEFTYEEKKEIMVDVMRHAVALGLTSVQSNDIGTTMKDEEEGFRLLREVYAEGRAPLRYRHQTCYNSLDDFKQYLKTEFRSDVYTREGLLTLGPLKLFKDGSLGARTALMRKPYQDKPDTCGIEWLKGPDLREYCRIAKAHNLQVVAHVIGERAVEDVVDAFITEGFIDGKNTLRHSLVHCQITDRELVETIAREDIGVMAQPVFLDYDMHIVEARCGKELASTSYAFGTLHRLGAHVAYGTDAPVEPMNPFTGLYMAVTRKDRKGYPEGGFYPEECVDIYTAVDAYTWESAYLEGLEDVKGRLHEGYFADLVVLDQNIFEIPSEEIQHVQPVMTMVAGHIVYEKE